MGRAGKCSAGALVVSLLVTLPLGLRGATPIPASMRRADPVITTALQRSLRWLEAHPTDARKDRLGWVTLDSWAWYVYARWHPEAAVRKSAADQVDRRLRGLTLPTEWTVASLSQWATVMQMASLRGMSMDAHRRALANVDLTAIMRAANPTTGWWTAELLRTAGFPTEADFSSSFIATASPAGAQSYVPTVRDAYRVFHEVVPAARLGTAEPAQLTPAQLAFVREIVPGLIRVSRDAGDTDALAEALVSAALVGGRETTEYREGLAWLLAQQHEDGTYRSARDARRSLDSDAFRHVVLVASHALLTSQPPAPYGEP